MYSNYANRLRWCVRIGLVVFIISFAVTGCLSRKLKDLEIQQLRTEIAAIEDTTLFYGAEPKLDRDYGGSVFISGDALNEFLHGLDDYKISLEKPRGAIISVSSARLEFKDGFPTATIVAEAVDRSNILHIKLRIRADVILDVDTANRQILVNFAVQEVLPDIRLSIFRWREFWFAIQIMTLEAQNYINTLPQIRIDLKPDLAIKLDPEHVTTSYTNGRRGWIRLHVTTPAIDFNYRFLPLKVVTLKDGVHVYFTLERVTP